MRQVYFDHQAATPVLPEVLAAMEPFFRNHYGSPSSLHHYGLQARDALAAARVQCARLVNAESADEILFTSGATEALNLAIKGVALVNARYGKHLVVSAIEHPAVLQSVAFLSEQGFTCTQVPVDSSGKVDPAAVASALTDHTTLICVQHANHEIGTLQPVAAIGEIATERGIPFLVDAATSGGWVPIDVRAMGASLLVLAPHRFYGPKGVGVLYRHRRARLTSLIHGGVQEQGRRAGTENVPAIVGAGVAAEIAHRELPRRVSHTAKLQQQLWGVINARVPYVKLHGPPPGPDRLTTNLNFSVEFVEGEGLALKCDMQGISIASGAACVTRSSKASDVLAAIGVPASLAQSNVLLTLGEGNTAEDMDYFLNTFPRLVEGLRQMSPSWDEFQQGLLQSAIVPQKS